MQISYLSKDEYRVSDVQLSNLHDHKFCVFDFEGTGIHFETECITQIGAVLVEDSSIHTTCAFNSLVRSPKPIPPAIEELTGITNQDMWNTPTFPEVYENFILFTRDTVLVTQAGYEYDVPLLEKYCREHQLPMLPNPILDTKALFTYLHPDIPDVISTDFLIRYYAIDIGDVKRHDALGDCTIIGKIFIEIMEEYKERAIKDLQINNLHVKRFIIPGMYLGDG
ncbi:3'-5' exonuclease [Paenibacillus mesophilus]|uniref:3'-5' exonuclease n=1 Tax=Paenibacillus mesophilus TaxID=2582849 RepID=UPI00110F3269|nr:3'-5' exonuclease [Paenibacillus mesophilus]TMV50323.1 3'-5' exonuclease [Paenibacillus mesophilus]